MKKIYRNAGQSLAIWKLKKQGTQIPTKAASETTDIHSTDREETQHENEQTPAACSLIELHWTVTITDVCVIHDARWTETDGGQTLQV